MASAARDPFFRANQIGVNNAIRAALVSAGVPDAQANGAGNMCMRCHSPNGWYSGRFDPTLAGDPEGRTMMHSIILSTDDEGILCEACHRTVGNVTMKRDDLDPNDPVWNMLGGIADWPHAGLPYVDQAGDPTIAAGNPYGDTSLQINDGMTYIGKYSGSSDVHISDLPTSGTYTGQAYGIYPNPWSGPKNAVPPGEPQFNAAGDEIVYAPDGSVPLHFEVPIGPPVNPQTGAVDYMGQAISLEHPTVGNREGMADVPAANKFLRSSEFCGTCHDLTVPVLNHGMPEQRTYTEWKFSEFGDGDGTGDVRCQDCHMPTKKHEFADEATPSVNADPILSGWFPYTKDRAAQGGTVFHKFAGANRDLPEAMKALYPEPDLELLGAPTGNDPRVFPGMLSTRDPMYDRNQRNSEIMLQSGVAVEIVSGPTYDATAGRWNVQVKVTNKSGHRIPSGYPDGRRFWIELQIKDAGGSLVYESGHYDADTAELVTTSAAGNTFARALEPTIDSRANAVMVYERITGTCSGGRCAGSPSLLNNMILFDNRILAKGFDYFRYTAANSYQLTGEATVYVTVKAASEATGLPVVVTAMRDQPIEQTIVTGGLRHNLLVPAGVYGGSMQPGDVFYIVYTPVPNTAHATRPPLAYQFGGKTFLLDAYLNGTRLEQVTFARPVVLTLTYDPAALNQLPLAFLQLFFWREGSGAWSSDGLVVVERNLALGRLGVSIAHVTEFAYFGLLGDNLVALPLLLNRSRPGLYTNAFLPVIKVARQ